MKTFTSVLLASLLFSTFCQSVNDQKNIIDEELMIAVPSSELYVRVHGNPEGALIVKNISVPVAVVQGEKDFVVGVEHGELIYRALTNLDNKKELHLIPETGHCPAIESPELLIEILNNFFDKYNQQQM